MVAHRVSSLSNKSFFPRNSFVKLVASSVLMSRKLWNSECSYLGLRINIMQTRQLGKTDLFITPLGFGSWAIGGGGWQFGLGSQDDRHSIGAINRALDLGINWIDTAAVYGLGHSEEIVGRAVKGRAERPYIFTKCSMVWDKKGNISHSLKRDSIRREVEDSLRRLQVESIDLYQIHWPEPETEIEEGWSALSE